MDCIILLPNKPESRRKKNTFIYLNVQGFIHTYSQRCLQTAAAAAAAKFNLFLLRCFFSPVSAIYKRRASSILVVAAATVVRHL